MVSFNILCEWRHVLCSRYHNLLLHSKPEEHCECRAQANVRVCKGDSVFRCWLYKTPNSLRSQNPTSAAAAALISIPIQLFSCT